MSSRRSSSPSSPSSSSSSSSSRASKIKNGEDELNLLILKLQALLPQLNQRQSSRVSAAKVLEETCSYIRELNKEVDELSVRLCRLLDSAGSSGSATPITTLQQQQQYN